MHFSVVIIAKNEAKTLPRLIKSLGDFFTRGGEMVVLDTGSTDGTPEIARYAGCTVEEVGDRFRVTISAAEAEQINAMFMVGDEPIVKAGQSFFNYGAARQYASTLASNDVLLMPDADEFFTFLDIDKLDEFVQCDENRFPISFVYARDGLGNPTVQFDTPNKFYNRKELYWVGEIHEVLAGNERVKPVPTSIMKLDHGKNEETDRGHYLTSLAYNCWKNPENHRNCHYFARELFYHRRYPEAIKEFKRHIAMNGWPSEAAQSMIYIGDSCNFMGQWEEAVKWFALAFEKEPCRREGLMRLAEHYLFMQKPLQAISYALGALAIGNNGFYSNYQPYYSSMPHEILYWAYWHIGLKDKSKEHYFKALEISPNNPKILADKQFYQDDEPLVSILIPTLGRPEGLQRCIDSIEKLNYREVEQITLDGPRPVPEKVAEMLKQAKGEYIVYAANDVEFTPDSIRIAVQESKQLNKGLVAFNTGPVSADEGNICEHFLIRRDLIDQIGGEIFDTEFNHVGVDNLLWAKCKKLGQAYRSEKAVVHHYHFSKGAEFDDVYQKGWSQVEQDRALLKKKMPYIGPGIEGWMTEQELDWLYETSKDVENVAEVGSWKGRSTHALLSGCAGPVLAVDHFQGSAGEDQAHAEAKGDVVYDQFMKNVGSFPNLQVQRTSSLEAAEKYPDKTFDMVFIDAEHTYEGVKADIRAWKNKAKKIICGHDYCAVWPGVVQAVNEELGPVQVCGSIWYQKLA